MRVVVTGAGGQLGAALREALGAHDALLLARDELDITNPKAVEAVLTSAGPDAVIHAAAWTDVDACESDPARARAINSVGARNVAALTDAYVVLISTDYVFDGMLGRAYAEGDPTMPLQIYGTTKRDGEQGARAVKENLAVVRSAWLYGAQRLDGEPARNFVASILRSVREGPVDVVEDQTGSPTCASDLATSLAALVEARTPGLFHVVNDGAVSRFELARAAVEAAGADPSLVRAIATADAPPRAAVRPAYAPLEGKAWRKAGFAALPGWDDALRRTVPEMVAALR